MGFDNFGKTRIRLHGLRKTYRAMNKPRTQPNRNKVYTVEATAREICERLGIRDITRWAIIYNVLERMEESIFESIKSEQ